jgi:biotin synthase
VKPCCSIGFTCSSISRCAGGIAPVPRRPEGQPIGPEYYGAIITTRTYQDRLDTLEHVREARIHICSGGIVGMGEGFDDRVGMIATLASLPVHPESAPINMLVQVEGRPLAAVPKLDPLDFVRTIAVAGITMPASMVRL